VANKKIKKTRGKATKTSAAKKPIAKLRPVKKAAAKKPIAKKAAPKKPVAKKAAPKKSVAKKAAAKKPVAKKAAPKKAAAKKPVAKKAAPKKSIAKKVAAKKPVAKKAAPKKPVAKKPAAKKSIAKKPAAKRSAADRAQDDFRDHVRLLLREHARVEAVAEIDGEYALGVRLAEGDRSILYLSSLFAETRELSPEEREAFLRDRLDALLAVDDEADDWESAAGRLVPTLRAATFGLDASLQAEIGGPDLVRRPFVPYVDVVLAIDEERTIRQASHDRLKAWGVTEAQAFARALANAQERLAPPTPYDSDLGPMFHVATDDDYQSSRLAIPGLLASFAGRVEGRPIAIVPERAQIYVAGDARPEMVERFCAMADREWEASSRAISPAIYTVDERGTVVPYVRAGSDELARKVQLGHVRLALFEYAEQKSILDKIHERDGDDVFVATLNGMLRDDGRPVTWCLWGEGIESLLPEAEIVFVEGLTDDERWSLKVPWRVVAEVMGDAWAEEEGTHPRRIRPRAWPNADQLWKLQSAAVELENLA
jgi:hypothetical protein